MCETYTDEKYLAIFIEEVQQDAGEVVSVIVGVAQLVGKSVQEEVAAFCVQVIGQAHEDVQGGLMHCVALQPRLVLTDSLQQAADDGAS